LIGNDGKTEGRNRNDRDDRDAGTIRRTGAHLARFGTTREENDAEE